MFDRGRYGFGCSNHRYCQFDLARVVVVVRRLIHGETLGSFLLHCDSAGRRLFTQGAAAGVVCFALYPVGVILFDHGSFVGNWGGMADTLTCAVAWGIGFLPVALFEEALFRGYMLQRALSRLPQWAAVLLPSLLFGAFHAVPYGLGSQMWSGMLNVCLFGVVLSVVVIRSNSLMCAVGIHWSWNLAQQVVLLRPTGASEPWFSLRAQEDLWAGAHMLPETGIIVTVVVGLLGTLTICGQGRLGGSVRSRRRRCAGCQ